MEREVVRIFDTTLRDGLRNSDVTVSLEDKLQFMQQLERLNVDAIEVGYGSPTQVELMRQLAKSVVTPIVLGLSRVNLKDVQRVLQGVEQAKKPGINIFIPASDTFLKKSTMSRQQALDAIGKAVAYARQYLNHIQVSAQDASRADPTYLVELFGAVIEAGATVLSIADSTSYALPRQFGQLCHYMRTHVPRADTVTWSVHCHNDLGLAVANSLAAVENGVRQVEGTINGIGERAGNTALEEVIMALKTRADLFSPATTHIVTEQLIPTSQLLSQFTGIMLSINKPVVGANSLSAAH
ncbi:MAG TPA: 2-isopropylmalate synthase [Candidatus Binatia bacterium]|nr:2-isopropylmalate synthase [Candidatus Binatia bacterium]